MANYEYLNKEGLSTLWSKIKSRIIVVSGDTDLTASRKASVGTIIVSKAGAGTSTGGGKAVIVTAVDSDGNASSFSYINGSDLIALNAAIAECSTAISDVKGSVGVIGNLNIAKATEELSADEIVVGVGAAGVKGSGMYFEESLNDSSTTGIPSSAAVGTYVNEKITEAQQAAIKTYAISVDAIEATPSLNKLNESFKTEADDLSLAIGVSNVITLTDGTQVRLGSMHIGDVVYIKESGYPDRWVSAITGAGKTATVTFSILETQDLDKFVQKPDSTLTGASSKTVTSLGVDSNGKLTATWSNIALGNIDSAGSVAATTGGLVAGDQLLIAKVSTNAVYRSGLPFSTDSGAANMFLSQSGSWRQVDVSAWKSAFTKKGQLIYSTAASTVQTLDAITVASGSAAILSLNADGVPTWDTITPIGDDTINALN